MSALCCASARRALVGGALAVSLLLQIGCEKAAPRDAKLSTAGIGGAPTTGQQGEAAADASQAQRVLDAMARTYTTASSYADSGTVRLRYQQGERPVNESVDFAVTFERPNKVRLNLYQALVVSDGQKFTAAIADLENEVLQVDAPETLTLDEIYRHELLNGALTNNLAGASPQLAFLLNKDAVKMLVEQGSAKPRLLSSGEIEGETCNRVMVERTDGELLLWVDQKTHLLRRVEYPVKDLLANMNKSGPVTDLSLVADFDGARVNQPIDPLAFQFEVPSRAKIVDSFVRRVETPRPEPPSALVGQQAPDFVFYTLDGRRVTKESLAGKIVVIDFWFTACAPCEATAPLVQKVFEQYAKDDRVKFYAVSISDPAGGNLEMEKTLQGWGSKLPILRDVDRNYDTQFKIPGAPALFVIGPDGRVQENHIGVNATLAEDLSETIQQLLAGKDTVDAPRKRYEQRLAEYQQAQAETSGSGSVAEEVPEAEIAPRSEPQKLKLTKLWSVTSLEEPGNILVTRDGEGPAKILALDGYHQVVELDNKGETTRHVLELPQGAVVRYLRSTTDGAGKRWYAGGASSQQQAHLFDADWKTTLSYPKPKEGAKEGLSDVQLADLNGDGRPELNLAFWGAGGVHNVALDGTLNWQNKALELVYRLAVTGADGAGQRSLIATNRQGTLVAIAPDGQESEHHSVGTRYLHAVFSADLNGDGQTEMCAIARDQANRESLVGIAPDYTALWEHPLPFGWQRYAIEPVTFGKVMPGGEAQWIVPGADGSIQFISKDGELLDRFHHGSALAGLAATEIDGKPTLVIATSSGVEAWAVEAK